MRRSSFIHLIGLAAAGLCSSLVASRAEGVVPRHGAGSVPPGCLPPDPTGGHRYVPVSAIALLQQTDLPEPTPVHPAPTFGMFSDAGAQHVRDFACRWVFPISASEEFNFQDFEKDLLSIRRDHPEVFDTAVRESIFTYWENSITHSPLLSRANRIATLQAEFDRVFVTYITTCHPK